MPWTSTFFEFLPCLGTYSRWFFSVANHRNDHTGRLMFYCARLTEHFLWNRLQLVARIKGVWWETARRMLADLVRHLSVEVTMFGCLPTKSGRVLGRLEPTQGDDEEQAAKEQRNEEIRCELGDHWNWYIVDIDLKINHNKWSVSDDWCSDLTIGPTLARQHMLPF